LLVIADHGSALEHAPETESPLPESSFQLFASMLAFHLPAADDDEVSEAAGARRQSFIWSRASSDGRCADRLATARS
jgi:hypothetical protein